MKHVIGHQVVLSQAPDGPLAVGLEGFAGDTTSKGYARWSLHRRILLAASFSRWLKQEKIELGQINSDPTASHTDQYLRHRAGRVRTLSREAAPTCGSSEKAARSAVRRWRSRPVPL